jgi:hypothetical protein
VLAIVSILTYLGERFVLSFMSINDELLKEEVQRHIDSALQEIEHDYKSVTGPNVKSRWDFIYGYEYGCIVMGVANYYHYAVLGGKGTTKEELKYLVDKIKDIVQDRLPEIRQAITRAEDRAKDNYP